MNNPPTGDYVLRKDIWVPDKRFRAIGYLSLRDANKSLMLVVNSEILKRFKDECLSEHCTFDVSWTTNWDEITTFDTTETVRAFLAIFHRYGFQCAYEYDAWTKISIQENPLKFTDEEDFYGHILANSEFHPGVHTGFAFALQHLYSIDKELYSFVEWKRDPAEVAQLIQGLKWRSEWLACESSHIEDYEVAQLLVDHFGAEEVRLGNEISCEGTLGEYLDEGRDGFAPGTSVPIVYIDTFVVRECNWGAVWDDAKQNSFWNLDGNALELLDLDLKKYAKCGCCNARESSESCA